MELDLSESPKKPLVSIIVPLFDMEEFVSETIESVLTQTVVDWEMLIIDDGSTDSSLEIAKAFVEKHPHKIYIYCHENNENKGANASRNVGIANAAGEFITFLDADDIYFPDTLERELKAFEEHPEADVVCGTFECWFSWSRDSDQRERDFVVDLVLETEKLHEPPSLMIQNLIAGGRKPGINCIMLRSVFAKKIGTFDEGYRFSWEDQIIWAKLTLTGKIYIIDAIVTKYRQHKSSMSVIDAQHGADIASVNLYLDWLEAFLHRESIKNKKLWSALHGFRNFLYLETRFKKIKQIYRSALPLYVRYKIRDKVTRSKQVLSGIFGDS